MSPALAVDSKDSPHVVGNSVMTHPAERVSSVDAALDTLTPSPCFQHVLGRCFALTVDQDGGDASIMFAASDVMVSVPQQL